MIKGSLEVPVPADIVIEDTRETAGRTLHTPVAQSALTLPFLATSTI